MKYTLALFLLLSATAHSQETKPLSLAGRIELPNVENRIDHFSADLKGQRLFMAALGNHTLEVIDVREAKRLQTLSDLAEPQGVYYDPASDGLIVACAKDGAVKVFDGSSYQLLNTAKFSADADNVRYDTPGHRIVVGSGADPPPF